MRTLKTILHPTDLSDLSQEALRKAYGLAQENGARLILLHVQEPQEVIEGEFGMPPPVPEPEDETIRAELHGLVPANPSIQVEYRLARGFAAEEIVRLAEDTQSDLIVLASHGRRNLLTHWLHANVAEQVAREAPCEVMIVETTPIEKAEPVFLD